MRAAIILALTAVLHAEPEWATIANDHLTLRVRKDAGACIGYLAGPDGINLLDAWDHGRFVQQSYYGDEDGSKWAGKPWRYNPVQGGDYKGNPATLLEFKATADTLYSKTRPRQWSSGRDVLEMTMEQWLTLCGPLLTLRIRMEYTGEKTHAPRHQEIPAMFVQKEYSTLLVHDGNALRRWSPGWPNEHIKIPRHWAAWLNAQGRGIGIHVPNASEATCYRFGDGSHKSHCSYIAPITTFALTPGQVFEYTATITIGTEAEIIERFERLAKDKQPEPGAGH